jgi:metal-sulfur cluster biosynthetic enzyme
MVTENEIRNALKKVVDPEIGLNIVDLGFIYGIKIEDGDVNIDMTLTMRGCPLHQMMGRQVEDAVKNLNGVKSAQVNIVWNPPWNPKMMSEEAKKQLGFTDEMMEG